MAVKKQPLEISCSRCASAFRLWVPEQMLSEWESGARVNCVRCGAEHLVRKGARGFEAIPVKMPEPEKAPAPSRQASVPRQEPIHAAAVQQQTYGTAEGYAGPEDEAGAETILLVEDDKLSRHLVESAMKDSGFRIIPLKNAAEALKAVRKGDVKLVVTDLYLKNPDDPESQLDGEELLKRITDMGYNIPAVITTGKDIIDDLVLDPKWFELRVKGFIQKGNPFWAEELKLKIKEVLYKG